MMTGEVKSGESGGEVECAHVYNVWRMYLEPLGVPKGGQRVQTLLPR